MSHTPSPRRTRTVTALAAAVALATGPLVVGPLAGTAVAAPGDLQLLAINDFHGRLLAPATTDDDQPIGGAAQLAGAVAELTTQAQADGRKTVFVSAGDNVGASPFESAVQNDAPTIAALNAMGLAASAVGNHEFDRGYGDYLADPASHGVDGNGAAQWPTLGANVEGEDPGMPEYTIETVSGVDVGFVGVVTEQTPSLVAAAGIAGLTFSDPLAEANRVADQITTSGEADIVVLLAHTGPASGPTDGSACPTGGEFGALTSGASENIDAIFAGHTHIGLDCTAQGRIPVLMGESYSTSLSRLWLDVDAGTGEVTVAQADVVAVEGFAPDAGVQAIVDQAVADAEVVGQVPVGEITGDITRGVDAAGEEDRGVESAAGNLVADAQLAATVEPAGAQIAMMNAGGVRDDFRFAASAAEGDGVVTYAEAATVQPFANGVVTVSLTGAQVVAALEQQWRVAETAEDRPVLWLGVSDGFEFAYDDSLPLGSRVLGARLDGEPLDPAATYRVTVNSFLADGGDDFTVFADGTDRFDTGFNDLNVLVDYFAAASPVDPASLTPRTFPGGFPVQEPAEPEQNPGLTVDTGRTGGRP